MDLVLTAVLGKELLFLFVTYLRTFLKPFLFEKNLETRYHYLLRCSECVLYIFTVTALVKADF